MSELIKRTLLIMAAGVISNAVQATDLNISGTVVASPCTVDVGSVSQDVYLGRLQKKDLQTAGSAGDWKSFEVKLTGCPAATTAAIATFSGVPFSGDDSLYSNTSTVDSAQGVAIQMVQDANKAIVQKNGSSMRVVVDAQHNATYALAARIISPVAGTVAPGNVTSVVQMNFTYQ